MTYSSTVLADLPLGFWRLGEASGTTLVDSSGNSRDGTYSGSVTVNQTGLLTGDSDKSADFGGGKAVIARNDPWTSQSVITVEAWIRADTFSSYNFVVAQDSNGSDGWWLVVKGSKVTGLIQSTEFQGATTLSTGTTYHIALTYDGTTAKLYLNGVLDGSLTLSANPAAGEDIYIGNWLTVGLPFDGRIDEVAYYATALSSTRLAAHYTAGTTVSPDATVAPPAASATAAGVVPVVSASSTVTPPAATATASALAPGVSAGGNATVSPPAATATATALAPTITQTIPAGTDTSNSLNGRRRRARASVVVVRPAAAAPSRAAVTYDKSVPYPPPTLVNGRPT